MTFSELPTTVGKRGQNTLPDGRKHRFTVVGEIRRIQSNHPGKVLLLQRMRFDDGLEELRLGYCIIGKKPGMAGKWVWGQSAPFLPAEDFAVIVDEALDKGWI
jgi:hypothetical protein